MPVDLPEEPARRLDHRRLDLDDVEVADPVAGDGAGGDPGAETDHERVVRVPMHEEWKVARHQLGRHVQRGRALRLAIDAEIPVPARLGDRDRGGASVAIEQDPL